VSGILPRMLTTIVADTLWAAHHDLRMMPGVLLNCRMTVLRLADGGLLLHSPIPIDDPLAAQLEALGPVRHIVAPNKFHHLFLAAARERYPTATLWLAPGLHKKRPDLPATHLLLRDEPPWHNELEPHFIAGAPAMNELVFYHHPTRTLLVTDLLFHLTHTRGPLSPLLFRIMGTFHRFTVSRAVRLIAVRDKQALRASLAPLLTWPLERVIMAHGEIVEGPDTAARTRQALTPLLAAS
jgi:hypothetical protein